MPTKATKVAADPTVWRFTDQERQNNDDRFWAVPVRLVINDAGEPGLWKQLWQGGGAISAVLPVLALHTWPDKRDIEDRKLPAKDGWTGEMYLSIRRVAALAGVNKDTVWRVYRRLQELGLMKYRLVGRARGEGGKKILYRLNTTIYPKGDEPFFYLPARLFYGGAWALLPCHSYRHLYITIACLDPIQNEQAYLEKIAANFLHMERDTTAELLEDLGEHGDDVWDELLDLDDPELITVEEIERYDQADYIALMKVRFLGRHRAGNGTRSIAQLAHISGLTRSTVQEALAALAVPIYGNRKRDDDSGNFYPPVALITVGTPPEERTATWYAPDRRAFTWWWKPEVMNDPERLRATRRSYWPTITKRTADEKRRKEAAARNRAQLAQERERRRADNWAKREAQAAERKRKREERQRQREADEQAVRNHGYPF